MKENRYTPSEPSLDVVLHEQPETSQNIFGDSKKLFISEFLLNFFYLFFLRKIKQNFSAHKTKYFLVW